MRQTIGMITRWKGDGNVKTAKQTTIGVVVAVAMLAAGHAWAGDLTPPGAPSPTMHTLEEIYQRIGTLEANQAALEARLNADGKYVKSGDMVLIPAGDFEMGDSFAEGSFLELPVHTVTVSAFYMDATEVTKATWDEVYTWGTNHGYSFADSGSGKATNHPVQMVSWCDCVAWANARSQFDGFTPCYTNATGTAYTNGTVAFDGGCDWSADGYRLPTEAEWEKAARGGASGRRFPWEDANTIQHARANYYASSAKSYDTSPTMGYHPSYDTGGVPYTSPVGSFAPNGYGLYDMAGNVYEWCWDWYGLTYYANSPDKDPRGPASGTFRMIRGGNWIGSAYDCRVTCRYTLYAPTDKSNSLGFRLVRAAP